MRRKVTIIELGLFERMVPLLAGYLKAHARSDCHLNSSYCLEAIDDT